MDTIRSPHFYEREKGNNLSLRLGYLYFKVFFSVLIISAGSASLAVSSFIDNIWNS
jgi:hypothetical protein